MKQLTILGSTGSIGCSTLDVVRHNPDSFSITALVAGKNVDRMVEQCLEFSPRYAVMDDAHSAELLRAQLREQGCRTEVMSGQQAAAEVAALDEVEQVMAAIVGAAGLVPTLSAIRAGKTVLLANKESLVTCGRLFMDAVQQYGARLLPVDSEHNAIFQSMPETIQHNLGYADLTQNGVASILLTGSGGPFRETAISELAAMTPIGHASIKLVDGAQNICRFGHHDEQRAGVYRSPLAVQRLGAADGSPDPSAIGDSLDGTLSGWQRPGAARRAGYAYADCPHDGLAKTP